MCLRFINVRLPVQCTSNLKYIENIKLQNALSSVLHCKYSKWWGLNLFISITSSRSILCWHSICPPEISPCAALSIKSYTVSKYIYYQQIKSVFRNLNTRRIWKPAMEIYYLKIPVLWIMEIMILIYNRHNVWVLRSRILPGGPP